MKERGMLFSAPMVRALLDGSKTQTRRIVKPQPDFDTARAVIGTHVDDSNAGYDPMFNSIGLKDGAGWGFVQPNIRCPYGQPGDRIWARETARVLGYEGEGAARRSHIRYEVDGAEAIVPFPDRLKPVALGKCVPNGCHREAARTYLEITGVRVERLQDISEADAKAEGAEPYDVAGLTAAELSLLDTPLMDPTAPYKNGYALLWESLAGAGSWNANPWVWVIEFKQV